VVAVENKPAKPAAAANKNGGNSEDWEEF